MNELSDMINEVDQDGNGTVEFAEFVILMTNKVREMTKEDEIYEAFLVLDKEKDDYISEKELKYFMRKVAHVKLSSEEAKAMIEFADTDGDGLISYEDFKAVVNMFQTCLRFELGLSGFRVGHLFLQVRDHTLQPRHLRAGLN